MKTRTEAPNIHETAQVVDRTLGRNTEVQSHCAMRESEMGDYSYLVSYGNVVWSSIGKFCYVAPCTIVGGVPAREIRRRFTEARAEALQEIAWWDRSHDRLSEVLPDIRALSIDAFIEKNR